MDTYYRIIIRRSPLYNAVSKVNVPAIAPKSLTLNISSAGRKVDSVVFIWIFYDNISQHVIMLRTILYIDPPIRAKLSLMASPEP